MAYARRAQLGKLDGAYALAGWLLLALVGCSNAPTSPGGQPSAVSGAGSGVGGSEVGTSGGGGDAAGMSTPPGAGAVAGSDRGGNAGTRMEQLGGSSNHGGGGGGTQVGGGGADNGGSSSSSGGMGVGGAIDRDGGMAGDPGAGGSVSYPMLTADAIGPAARVAGGYTLAESPLWDHCNHRLLFSDAAAGTGGIIYALGADGMVTSFMTNTGKANGLAFDLDGSLLMAKMGAKHIGRRDKTGMVTAIDPPGPALHTPDDLVVGSDGTIYFTDGDFCPIGNLLGYGSVLPVYSFKPGASKLVNQGSVGGPNGIELSPDEKTLYVDAYGEGALWTFAVGDGGKLTKASRALATGLSKPDSLCVDAAGNLYVGVTPGLQVLRPDGTKVKLIPVTALGSGCLNPGVTNCGFGGEDGKTLYITTWQTLYKVEGMPIPGLEWVYNQKRLTCN
jgi:gluconolactonase